MFFIFSKLFWLAAAPTNLLGLLALGGLIAQWTRLARLGRGLLAASGIGLLVLGNGPAGAMLISPLENRFPRPAADMPAPDGIILLGGGLYEIVSATRDTVVLGRFGSRMTEALALARRYPAARIVFTGGEASLTSHGTTESEIARRFFDEQGIDPARITYEDRSRNTFENAEFARDLVHPTASQRWLLVTSGFHMPRAMGLFRKAGFNVTAWPADYLTTGRGPVWAKLNHQSSNGLLLVDTAMREWLGLAAYRLTGKLDSVFPAP